MKDTVKYMPPTWGNQIIQARQLAQERGIRALDNPHGMIGRTCRCNDCFCCAAAAVVAEMRTIEPQHDRTKKA